MEQDKLQNTNNRCVIKKTDYDKAKQAYSEFFNNKKKEDEMIEKLLDEQIKKNIKIKVEKLIECKLNPSCFYLTIIIDKNLIKYKNSIPKIIKKNLVDNHGWKQDINVILSSTKKNNIVDGGMELIIHVIENFQSLLLKKEIIKKLEYFKYNSPTKLQFEYLPQAIVGLDLICQTPPESDQTMFYFIAILQQCIDEGENGTAIIICPNAEIGEQITHKFNTFSKNINGVNLQFLAVNPDNVTTFDKNDTKYVVLTDCELIKNKKIQQLLESLPTNRQTMMFSHNSNIPIELCKKFTNDPLEINYFINNIIL